MNAHVHVNNPAVTPTVPAKPNIAPCEIWNNWNNARTSDEGRAAIEDNHIARDELANWKNGVSPVRQADIRFVLESFARQHR